MYRRGVVIGVLLTALLAVFSAPAAAQTPAPVSRARIVFPVAGEITPPATSQTAMEELCAFFFDFDVMHYSEESSHVGVGFGGVMPIGPRLAILAGLGLHRFGYSGGGTNLTTVYGGVAYRIPSKSKAKAFVQGVAGIDHWGDSVFMIEPGGGVEYPLTDTINFRATVGIHVGFWDGDASTGVRAAFGVSMPIGKK